MNIKTDLLKKYVVDLINSNLCELEIDADAIADTTSIKILTEIQKVVKDNTLSDFDAMEEIVLVFEKYGIDSGARHDF